MKSSRQNLLQILTAFLCCFEDQEIAGSTGLLYWNKMGQNLCRITVKVYSSVLELDGAKLM